MIELRVFGLALVLSLVGMNEAASVGSVNNFRIVSITGQSVSFSWEVYNIPIGNISYFEIHHHTKVPEISTVRGRVHIRIDETANSANGSNLTFAHIVYVRSFGYLLEKIMYLQIILSNGSVLESEQIYAETFDVTAITIELRVKLSDARSCFQETATISEANFKGAILRTIPAYCQCTRQSMGQLRLYGEYFSCSTTGSGYATFRSYVQTWHFDPVKRSIAVEAIRRWLQDPNGNTVLVGGTKYEVETGSCGLTVPHLNAPFCGGTSVDAPLIMSQVTNETAVIVLSVFTPTLFMISLCLAVIAIICSIKQSPRCCGKRAK